MPAHKKYFTAPAILPVLFACLFFGNLVSQNFDSLRTVLKNARHDSTRCYTYLCWGGAIYERNPDSALTLWEEVRKTAMRQIQSLKPGDPQLKLFKNYYGESLINLSSIYDMKGDAAKTAECIKGSIAIAEETGDKEGLAQGYNNLGFLYDNLGDIAKALDYYSKGLKIQEEIGDKANAAYSLSNIGLIYKHQGDITKALEYYERSLAILEAAGNSDKGIATLLNNIGGVYREKGQWEKAIIYYTKSMNAYEQAGDKGGLAQALNNIGAIYKNRGDLTQGLEFYTKSLALREQLNEKRGIAESLYCIAGVYIKKKEWARALDYTQKSMKLSKQMGYPQSIRNAAERLAEIYKATNHYKLALDNFELYIQMRDSVTSRDTKKASIKSQLKYEYEKKAVADSVAHASETELKNAELAQQRAEIKNRRNQQYALYGGLAMVIIFAAFMYNRFKITQRQKTLIEQKEKETQQQNEVIRHQKDLVEEKQKEILDSITYARRIQRALITSEKYIGKELSRLSK